MGLTDEQKAIVEASKTSDSLVVNALAGSGKTSTALACAKANRLANIGYFCFNRANAEEMRRKCISMGIRNVYAATLHSLAFRKVAQPLRDDGRTIGSFRPWDIRSFCTFFHDEKHGMKRVTDRQILDRARTLLLENLEAFCHSEAPSFKEFRKIPKYKPMLWQLKRLGLDIALFESETESLWNEILENPQLPIPHNVYLKLFHMNLKEFLPELGFDMIIIDEAQDLFPVTEDIARTIQKYGARAIYLGDRYQQIYSWNKSVNAMEHFEEGSDILMLTQSFRCPANVTDAAAPWLSLLGFQGEFKPAPETERKGEDRVFVSRTNTGIFAIVNHLLDNGFSPEDICFVGGQKGYSFDMLEDRLHFVRGERDLIRFPPMAAMKDDAEYEAYAKITKDAEMSQAAIYTGQFGPRAVARFLENVKKCAFCEDPRKAAVCVSTGHKIKGLEFSRVSIIDTFRDILADYAAHKAEEDIVTRSGGMFDDDADMRGLELQEVVKGKAMPLDAEDCRLAYVALTRSLRNLDAGVLDIAGERHDKIAQLIEQGEIVLTDRNSQGNIRLYGEKESKEPAEKPASSERRGMMPGA